MSTDHKPEDDEKEAHPEKAGVPIGVHEDVDWNERRAVKLVRRAAMHYHDAIPNSAQAALLEALSNAPTWYLAYKGMGNYFAAGAAGAGLTGGILTETGIATYRLFKVLNVIEEYQDNLKKAGKNHEKKSEALRTLEHRTHEGGLLYEGIPEYDLRDYPAKTINFLINTRKNYLRKGAFQDRALDVGLYLRFTPAKELALGACKAPVKVYDAAYTLFDKTVSACTSIAANTTKEFATNWANREKYKNIWQGITAIPKMFYYFNPITLSPRFKEAQKPYFKDLQNGTLHDGHVFHSELPGDDMQEIQNTRRATRANILQQDLELAKLGAEKTFMGIHFWEAAHSFDAESLQNGLSPDGDLFADPNNMKFILSSYSIVMAWGAYAHISHHLHELVETGKGERSKDAEQHRQVVELYEKLAKKQADNKETSRQGSQQKENTAPEPEQ